MKGEILDSLRTIKHPTRNADIVGAGILTVSDAIDGNVDIDIEVEKNIFPLIKNLNKSIEDAVLAVPGVITVEVKMSANKS